MIASSKIGIETKINEEENTSETDENENEISFKGFGAPFPQRFFYSVPKQQKLISSFAELPKYETVSSNTMEEEQKPPYHSTLTFSSKESIQVQERILDRPPGLEEEKLYVEKFDMNKFLLNLEAFDALANNIGPNNQNYQSPSVLDLVQDKFEKNYLESYFKEADNEESSAENYLNHIPYDLQKIFNGNNINVDNLDDLKTLGRNTLANLHQKLSLLLGIQINLIN